MTKKPVEKQPAGARLKSFSTLKIFSIFCACIGFLAISLSIHLLYLALVSNNWPQASGTIVESKLNSRKVDTQEGVKVINAFTIKYEYRVKSHKYLGGTVAFGKLVSPEVAVDKYKPGDTVNVHYHPNKSSESVLEPGINAGNFMGMLFGLVFIGVALLIEINSRSLHRGSDHRPLK